MKDLSLLKKKLAGYSAVAGVVIACVQESDGQIIYTDVNPDEIVGASWSYLDLDNDSIFDFRFLDYDGINGYCPWGGANADALASNYLLESAAGHIAALNLSSTIEQSFQDYSVWATHSQDFFHYSCFGSSEACDFCDTLGPWDNVHDKYMGIILHQSDGNHYGWIRLTLGRWIENRIKDYAYQSQPDISILAGQFDNVDTLQAVVTPSDTISVCTNTTVQLTVNAGPAYLIQWQKNGVNIFNGVNPTYSTVQPGDYRTIVSALGFTDTSNTVTVMVHTPMPVITQSGDTLFATVTAAASYQWYESGPTLIIGATNASYIFTQPGVYYVSIIDSEGCISPLTGIYAAACINIDLTNNPLTSIICQGDHAPLQAYVYSGMEYQWFLNDQPIAGATTAHYNAYSAGQYFVTSRKISNNCRDTSSTYSLLVDNPVLPVIQQETDSLVSTASSGYQWYFNGSLIPGATNQIFIPTQAGSYQVEVTDSNGCSAISQSFDFIATNTGNMVVADFFDAFVEDHQLHIHFNQSPLSSRMILFNDLGVKLREAIITQNELVMDVSQLGTGIYFVAVDNQNRRSVKKVVIE